MKANRDSEIQVKPSARVGEFGYKTKFEKGMDDMPFLLKPKFSSRLKTDKVKRRTKKTKYWVLALRDEILEEVVEVGFFKTEKLAREREYQIEGVLNKCYNEWFCSSNEELNQFNLINKPCLTTDVYAIILNEFEDKDFLSCLMMAENDEDE